MRFVFVAWVVLGLLVGASLLAPHLLALPTPAATNPALEAAIATSRSPSERDRWYALHVLYESCGCSQRILDHLLASPRPVELAERIVLVADDGVGAPALRARLDASAFAVDVVLPDDLEPRYVVGVAPVLVVAAPDGSIGYVGGYTRVKQGPDLRDHAIIAALRAGSTVAALPTFGCAVSRGLADDLDPLGIRRLE